MGDATFNFANTALPRRYINWESYPYYIVFYPVLFSPNGYPSIIRKEMTNRKFLQRSHFLPEPKRRPEIKEKYFFILVKSPTVGRSRNTIPISARRHRSEGADGVRLEKTILPHNRNLRAPSSGVKTIRCALLQSNFAPSDFRDRREYAYRRPDYGALVALCAIFVGRIPLGLRRPAF